jgi:hypothetical protein
VLQESLEAMAGGHHGNGITYGGLTLHTTKGWHSRVGKGMCAMMWCVNFLTHVCFLVLLLFLVFFPVLIFPPMYQEGRN